MVSRICPSTRGADIAPHRADPVPGNSAKVLALSSRDMSQAVLVVRLEHDLRMELPNRRGEWHHVEDRWGLVEDPLRRHDDGGMPEAGFVSLGHPEIEVDDVTRARHRATPLRRREAPR